MGLMWTMFFFTVPIMAYIVKGAENMNGGLIKSKQDGIHCQGPTPPPHGVFCFNN